MYPLLFTKRKFAKKIPMSGLLKEKIEIENLQKEYLLLSKINFCLDNKTCNKNNVIKESVLEQCEL